MQNAVAQVNEELRGLGGEQLEATRPSSEQLEIAVPAGVDVARIEKAISDLKDRSELGLQQAKSRQADGRTVLVYNVRPGGTSRSTWPS